MSEDARSERTENHRDEKKVLDPTSARQGENRVNMLFVLVGGIALALAAWILVEIVF